jgi:hypothetical protein
MVRRYTPRGAMDCAIAVPTKNPTCVVFAGSGLDQLYVMSSRQEMSLEELEVRSTLEECTEYFQARPGFPIENLRIRNSTHQKTRRLDMTASRPLESFVRPDASC